jgi:hypothetical protein
MKLQLDKRFQKHVRGIVEKYSFDVGVLDDAPHKSAKYAKKGQNVLSNYAGGPVRKTTQKAYLSVADVSESFRKFLGFNYLTKPFAKKNSEIVRFTNEFLKLAFGRSQKKRVENLLQAIVRNPILRKDYGDNSAKTQKAKGFNRLGIDTGQLFKGIKARVKVRLSNV